MEQSITCIQCGELGIQNGKFCSACGAALHANHSQIPPSGISIKNQHKHVNAVRSILTKRIGGSMAGIVCIVTGTLAFTFSLACLCYAIDTLFVDYNNDLTSLGGTLAIPAFIVSSLLGTLAIIGGIHVFKRNRYDLAMVGACCSTLMLAFAGLFLAILGIMAILEIINSKSTFKSEVQR